MPRLVVAIIVLAALSPALRADEQAAIPDAVQAVLAARCLDCHSGPDAEAGVRLDARSIDWAAADQVGLWSRVVEVIENRRMPPPDAEPATPEERAAVVTFLDPPLIAHTPFGGTPPRRLNRAEY
ncbi:MAG: c-type cytochrome domain-containing protein, partial [Planctomycetia bacterium]